jgi:diacylglycerol kinase (ATP)
MTQRFSWKKRRNSFAYAFQGLSALFKTEHNAWIHAASTVLILILSFLFNISAIEWCLVIIVMGGVWTAEIFNTAIEKMMDHVTPERHPVVKLVKDLSAAAVLLTALAAFITGCIIFIPKIF